MKKCNNYKVKSYIWVYWMVWILISLRTVYIAHNYGISFGAVGAYAAGTWSIVGILSLCEFYRLVRYMKEVYPAESEKVREASGGICIGKKTLMKFLDEANIDDIVLMQLADNYRKFYRFSIVVFIGIACMTGVILPMHN